MLLSLLKSHFIRPLNMCVNLRSTDLKYLLVNFKYSQFIYKISKLLGIFENGSI